MALFINIRTIWLSCLLIFSTTIHANSTHNLYMMTLSILSYTKWKNNTATFCIIPTNPQIMQSFQDNLKTQNMTLSVKTITAQQLSNVYCDIAFFSHTTPEQEQKLIQESLNKNILTFSTDNIDCEIGSVFCLYTSKLGKSQFKLNLDSLSKSKVHVDPRVFLLAKNSE